MIVSLTGASGGLIRARETHSSEVAFLTSVGLDDAAIAFERATPLCGICLESIHRDQICNADGTQCRLAHLEGNQYDQNNEGNPSSYAAIVSVPLDFEGHAIGVLNLFFSTPPAIFALDQILKPVGLLLGLSLESQRVEEEQLRLWNLRLQHLLAAELHDGFAQQLSYARMTLRVANDALLRLLPKHPSSRRNETLSSEWKAILARYQELESLIATMHEEVRHLIRSFTHDEPSQYVVDWAKTFADFRSHYPGCELEVSLDPGAMPSSPFVCEQLYRIVQEALTNIRKHAEASRVEIRLTRERESIVLRIRDNGRGIPTLSAKPSIASSFGLKLMKNRVALMGGRWEVESSPHEGTTIRITIPIPSIEKRP